MWLFSLEYFLFNFLGSLKCNMIAYSLSTLRMVKFQYFYVTLFKPRFYGFCSGSFFNIIVNTYGCVTIVLITFFKNEFGGIRYVHYRHPTDEYFCLQYRYFTSAQRKHYRRRVYAKDLWKSVYG